MYVVWCINKNTFTLPIELLLSISTESEMSYHFFSFLQPYMKRFLFEWQFIYIYVRMPQ